MSPSMPQPNIEAWIAGVERSGFSAPNHERALPLPGSKRTTSKRKRSNMDEDTPTGNKRRQLTPSATLSNPETNSTSYRSISARTNSRSSSPTKRQRQQIIQHSKPYLEELTSLESTEWKEERNVETVPKLKELLEHISDATASQTLSTTVLEALDEVGQEVARCGQRRANEESWSDWVVLPVIKAARSISRQKDKVDIINVKAVDVWPLDLLDGALGYRSLRKRVDYSIGIKVGNRVEKRRLLESTDNLTFTFAQSNHDLIRDRVLCSHVELKVDSDDAAALAQLKTWCAAGFRKQRLLWDQNHHQPPGSSCRYFAPQPVWIWNKDRVQLSIAVMDWQEDTIYFLAEQTFLIAEQDTYALRRLVTTMARVMDWGSNHYLSWFKTLCVQSDQVVNHEEY